MAVIHQIVCDRCGFKQDHPYATARPVVVSLRVGSEDRMLINGPDLCKSCLDELEAAIACFMIKDETNVST